MSASAWVDIFFSKPFEFRDTLSCLLGSGWEISFDGEVFFLTPSDMDSYDWVVKKSCDFDLEELIKRSEQFEKIGIAMVYKKSHGGDFLIYIDRVSLSLSINRLCLKGGVPDFSFYLDKLSDLLAGVSISSIDCKYCTLG